MLETTSREPGGTISACSSLSLWIEEFVMNWFRRYGLDFHAGEWLALATVVLLSFALCIAFLRLVFWLFGRERDPDESEDESAKEYRHIHGE